MFDFIKKLFSPDPEDLYRLGEILILRGDYKGAINCYNRLLKIDPDNTIALKKKSFLLFTLGMYEEVIEAIDKVLAIEPEDTDSLNGKAAALCGQEKYEEATGYYDKVLAISPDNINALSGKAWCVYIHRNYEEVIKFTDKILMIDSNSSNTWTTRGMALAAMNRYEEAINCYDKALQIEVKHIDAWTGKAMALAALGRYEDYVECQRKALEYTSALLPSLGPQVDTVSNAKGRFGYDRSNPVPVCFQSGELEYLATLECECGCNFDFHRKGSFGKGPDGHIIDCYELMCKSKKHHITLFMDMYHKSSSSLLPEGLSRGTEKGTGLPFYVENFPEGITQAIEEALKLRKK